MAGNDRLEKVISSLELVRISNHAIKGIKKNKKNTMP